MASLGGGCSTSHQRGKIIMSRLLAGNQSSEAIPFEFSFIFCNQAVLKKKTGCCQFKIIIRSNKTTFHEKFCTICPHFYNNAPEYLLLLLPGIALLLLILSPYSEKQMHNIFCSSRYASALRQSSRSVICESLFIQNKKNNLGRLSCLPRRSPSLFCTTPRQSSRSLYSSAALLNPFTQPNPLPEVRSHQTPMLYFW